MLHIHQFPVLNDNYTFVLHEDSAGVTAVVDPALVEPVLDYLGSMRWGLDLILNTHHHFDHVGGNLELKAATGCKIIGHAADAERIPGIDRLVTDGESVAVGESEAEILFLPGHTSGIIAYYFAKEEALFCGDVLFGMGCGRLFDGTLPQMHKSLQRLKQLPDATRIYCAHEYTQANGNFALTVEPGNEALQARMQKVQTLRAQNKATVPLSLAEEKATNPFLRTDSTEIHQNLGLEQASDEAVFIALRKRKDCF